MLPITACKFRRALALASTLMLPSAFSHAGAQGNITFSPADAAAVPALGGVALILVALLLIVIALRYLRHGGGGVAPAIAVGMSLLALTSAGGGLVLISDAQATIPVETISNPEGQTFPVRFGEYDYENASGLPMEVVDLDVSGCFGVSGSCELGTVLEDGGSCNLDCGD